MQDSWSIQELYSENRSQIACFLAEIWLAEVEKPALTGWPGHTEDTDHNKYKEKELICIFGMGLRLGITVLWGANALLVLYTVELE